jgi:hypothetical protein
MNLKIYQCYYEESQLEKMNGDSFIPFDNTENKNPELREYVLWKKGYEMHKDEDCHWGIMSWRWLEKTKLPEIEFKEWITNNPGHDVYYMDPFLDVSVIYPNLWVQGDIWHPGLKDFANRLFPKLGITKSVDDLYYDSRDFLTCGFFVGNQKFWTNFLEFVDRCIDICKGDEKLNYYMFEKKISYNGGEIPNFSFIVERLFSLYSYLNPNLNSRKFPIENECYTKMYGDAHKQIVFTYNKKEEQLWLMNSTRKN